MKKSSKTTRSSRETVVDPCSASGRNTATPTSSSTSSQETRVDPCLGLQTHNTRTPSTSCTTPEVVPAMGKSLVPGDLAAGSVRTTGSGPSKDLPGSAYGLPYPDRVALCTLPSAAVQNRPRLRMDEIWDALSEHFDPLEEKFAQIQYIREDRFRVWCCSPEFLEEFVHTGVNVRGHPIQVYPYRDRSWVTITHLPYGVTEVDVRAALSPYGTVHEVTFVNYRKIRTGTVKVRMDLSRCVPTRIRVNGHPGLAYHQGQVRTCFNCGASGHESRKCPRKLAAKVTKAKPTPSDATDSASRKKRKRSKRKKRASAQEGEAGPSSSGTDNRPAKRPAAAMETEQVESLTPSVPDPPVAVVDPVDAAEMDTAAPEPPTDGDLAPGESMRCNSLPPVIPNHLFLSSTGAAREAPPDDDDEEHPRHELDPVFRRFDDTFVYVEEGELSRSLPSVVVDQLSQRGDVIRATLDETSLTGHSLIIRDEMLDVTRTTDQVRVKRVALPSRKAILEPYRPNVQTSCEAVPPPGGGASS